MMIQVNPEVMFREIDDEAVLLDAQSGTYYALNEVGARTWTLLHEGKSIEEIEETLLASYDIDEETLRADLGILLADLAEAGLIVREAVGEAP